MAIPSIALPVVPIEWRSYLGWSIGFALVAAPLCFAMSFDTHHPLKKLGLWILAFSLVLYGVSIGKAFLYVTVTLSLAVVAFLKNRKMFLGAIPLVAGVVLVVGTMSGSFLPYPLERLVEVERQQQSWGGRAGRVAVGADAVAIWAKHPVLGVGPGNSWPYMNRYSVIDTPHNQYLNILLELGVVGLACFLWFLGSAFTLGLRLLDQLPEGFHRTIVIGWLGLFAAMVVTGLTGDFTFHSIRNGGLGLFSGYYLQWVMLGIVVSVASMEGNDR
jgi:O-antigen ligase